MGDPPYWRLQIIVFAVVSASFANIYITQPVLPVLQREFSVDLVRVSFTVSAVILGITLSNLPFGFLADRVPIRAIILAGGILVAGGGFVCAVTTDLWVLIGARFFQGLFIPALTTCVAAYLAKTLPAERLNVVMGSYVSATVLGGMGGRLLGGWIHRPFHWRYAFVAASAFILVASVSAFKGLPRGGVARRPDDASAGFLALLGRWELLRLFFCAAGSFAVFSSVFNFLPYRLAAPPFNLSTEATTFVYMVYVVGIFMGPTAGKISNRVGSGATLIGGAAVFGGSLALTLVSSVAAVVVALVGVCAGFFAIHAAAVGSLNRKLSRGQGRANALYVLFYYAGGWLGITGAGFVYRFGGWSGVIHAAMVCLLIPVAAGLGERRGGISPRTPRHPPNPPA